MIGKLKNLLARPRLPSAPPAPAPNRKGVQVRDSFAVKPREAEVRASGPKVLLGMPDIGGAPPRNALVLSTLTQSQRATYQETMLRLQQEPVAQAFVNKALELGKQAELLGAGARFTGLDDVAETVQTALAYVALSPEERAEYDAVMEAAGDDPETQEALRQLLREGKLVDPPASDGRSLLSHLHELATSEEMFGDYASEEVLAEVVQYSASPTLEQEEGTVVCGPMALVFELAEGNPAEYARLMSEATRTGQTTLANPVNGQPATIELRDPSVPGDLHHNFAIGMLDEFVSGNFKVLEDGTVSFIEPGHLRAGISSEGAETEVSGIYGWSMMRMSNAMIPGVDYHEVRMNHDADPNSDDVATMTGVAEESLENGGTVKLKLITDGEPATGHWIVVTRKLPNGEYEYTDAAGNTGTGRPEDLVAQSDSMVVDQNTVPSVRLDDVDIDQGAIQAEIPGGGSSRFGKEIGTESSSGSN